MLLTFFLLLSAALTLLLAGFGFSRRGVRGGKAFAALLLCGALWQFAVIAMLLSPTTKTALFWYRVSLAFVSFSPVLIFFFVLIYTHRDKWLTLFRGSLLMVLPVLTQIVIWTDQAHGLFFRAISVSTDSPLKVLSSWTPGPWFTIHSVYSFGLTGIALLLLWITAIHQFRFYRNHSIALILGSLAVILPNLGFALNLIPPDVIVLPFGFLFMGLAFSWAVFKEKMFSVLPVARDKLVDIMTDAMVVTDSQNCIVDINPAGLAMFGFQADALIGRQVTDIFAPWPEVLALFSNAPPDDQEIALTRDEALFQYNVRISFLSDAKRAPAGRLILFTDITRRKAVEEKLKKYRENLEALVAQRTAELNKTKEIAENANNVKTQLLTNMRHELRTPLNGIISAASFIEPQMPPEELLEFKSVIQSSGNALLQKIESILDFSASTDGKLALNRMPFRLDTVISELKTTFMHKGEIIAVDLLIEAPNWNLPNCLKGDPARLSEILNNLLENAAKFTAAKPKVQLRIRAANQTPTAVTLHIRVQDNGIGIPAQYLKTVFEPFFQVDTSTTRQYDGVGIGLSICQQLVELMGGKIRVESQLGQGSTVHVQIPFERQAMEEAFDQSKITGLIQDASGNRGMPKNALQGQVNAGAVEPVLK